MDSMDSMDSLAAKRQMWPVVRWVRQPVYRLVGSGFLLFARERIESCLLAQSAAACGACQEIAGCSPNGRRLAAQPPRRIFVTGHYGCGLLAHAPESCTGRAQSYGVGALYLRRSQSRGRMCSA